MTKEHVILLKSTTDEQLYVYEDTMTSMLSEKREDSSFYMVMVEQENFYVEDIVNSYKEKGNHYFKCSFKWNCLFTTF